MAWKNWEQFDPMVRAVVDQTPAKRSKYHAQPTTVDGIRFDSKKEATRYAELKLMEKAGQIRALTLQPEFQLTVPALHRIPNPEGELVFCGVGVYRADFGYEERQGRRWVPVTEDVKGVRTSVYRLKKRMVEKSYGIEIREV